MFDTYSPIVVVFIFVNPHQQSSYTSIAHLGIASRWMEDVFSSLIPHLDDEIEDAEEGKWLST